MKKNVKLTLLLIFLLFIGLISINSCQKETVAEKTTNKSDNYFVNDLEACNYSEKLFASNLLKSHNSSSIDSNCSDDKKVKSITSIPDKNKLTAMYVINYEQGGFAILSADKRLVPILAYSSVNNLSDSSVNRPPALESWLIYVKENIESVRSSNEDPTKEIQEKWKNLENEDNSYLKLKNADPDECCTDRYEEKAPMLSTKWHQGCGFNSLLPTENFIPGCMKPVPCFHAYAGCVAIAMAQVMKFHQRPTSYNWSLMPNRMPTIEPFPTEPARLILAIDAVDALNPTYNCDNGTGATLPQAAIVLKNKFGYSSATYSSSYNFMTVESNLRSNRPVILCGGSGFNAHAWVCDGFLDEYICMYDGNRACIGAMNYLYFSMNWGYEGEGDGLFAFNNFNPVIRNETKNFNSNTAMIYNIIP